MPQATHFAVDFEQTKMIKVLSWNIRQGGGSRIAPILKVMETEQPDILTFSEYRNNDSGIKIRTGLLKMGYRYQAVSNADNNVNTAFIAAKFPFNSVLFPKADPIYAHSIIRADFDAFNLYGMYLPHKKKHQLFDFLINEELTNPKPSILAGDFNTGHNYIDQEGNSFWYTDKLKKIESMDYVDAFRLKNDAVKEYSWYSHQGNGYRYDHIYVHNDLIPIISDCYYLHECREKSLSDHSPMILHIG